MALPLPPGLTPPEIAFICEMELVTIIPRQKLEAMKLLGGPLKSLNPPQRSSIPLWLALLLKRQRRANIVPPPWLSPESLTAILDHETKEEDAFSPPPRLPPAPASNTLAFSPPFLQSSTANAAPDALPYHWLELGEMLLEAASDDFEEPDTVRKLLRGLREVRMAKLRKGVEVLDAGGGVKMNGVGGMELSEARSFITGVIDGLRKLSASKEQLKKERDREERDNGYSGTADYDDDEMDMQ
ncbi:DNA replication complex GINS protein-like protein psf2 [Byssothecium circinans]|uniref:DNA replication complex GINS protein PSF2 n=1 Tax=Byssothecium circinans TaxID=147558 RepID=A0A6A5U8C2_9PLEO|nr:DNA replication complex GINS protein-like protein psf2 [Byssothecium circinans]